MSYRTVWMLLSLIYRFVHTGQMSAMGNV